MRNMFTLAVVVQNGNILLGKKRTGHGAGKWNGFGGKVNPNENIREAARRECEEEAGITPIEMQKVGNLLFQYTGGTRGPYEHDVSVFIVHSFTGSPKVTDEMDTPTWFSFQDIPYDTMWEDDRIWLPVALSGKKFQGTFVFDAQYKLVDQNLQFTE